MSETLFMKLDHVVFFFFDFLKVKFHHLKTQIQKFIELYNEATQSVCVYIFLKDKIFYLRGGFCVTKKDKSYICLIKQVIITRLL